MFSTMQTETFNHADSTDDAQEKQACSYKLAFAENKKFVNSKFGAHLLFNLIHLTKRLFRIHNISQVLPLVEHLVSKILAKIQGTEK